MFVHSIRQNTSELIPIGVFREKPSRHFNFISQFQTTNIHPFLRARVFVSLFCACADCTYPCSAHAQFLSLFVPQTQILIKKLYFDHFNSSHHKCKYVAPDTITIFLQYPSNGRTAEHSRNYVSTVTLLLAIVDELTRRNTIAMPCAHFLTRFQSHYLILYFCAS